MAEFSVDGLDHVHLEVADREAAAAWLNRVLGLRRAEVYAGWADDPMGPMFLESASGRNCIALFARGRHTGSAPGDHTIAFRVNGPGFLAFLDSINSLQLSDHTGAAVMRDHRVDHQKAWSIYFCDPDGNRFEVTTYDYEVCAAALRD